MSSWDEKTIAGVSQDYDIPEGTVRELLSRPRYGRQCPFPARKFEGKWLIDTGSDEFKAYLAFYGKQHVVKARREGRLRRTR
jgi:hypothetical protein